MELFSLSFSLSLLYLQPPYRIRNMVGMVVMQMNMSAQQGFNSASFDINDLPSGVYYLIVKENNEDHFRKQVKFLKY